MELAREKVHSENTVHKLEREPQHERVQHRHHARANRGQDQPHPRVAFDQAQRADHAKDTRCEGYAELIGHF